MRNTRLGILAAVLVGGFLVYRNRFQIQKMLESYGIRTPLLKENLSEAARSIASKVSGRIEERKVGNY